MPSCVRCNEFYPREAAFSECPACGGEVLSGEALVEARSAARGMSPEDYLANREVEREIERQARRDAEAAEYEAEEARAAQQLAADAAATGLTVEEYQAKLERERWLSAPGDVAEANLYTLVLAVPVTGAVGIIVTMVFIVLGLSPWAAVCGTVLGGAGGLVLAQVLFFGTWAMFDRLVRIPGVIQGAVRRFGDAIIFVALLSTLVLPPALVVIVSLLLPPITPALAGITIGVAAAAGVIAWLGWRWFTSEAK